MTNTQLTYWRDRETRRNNVEVNAETQRANLAREAETNRHNLATEKFQSLQLAQQLGIANADRVEKAREADQTLLENSRANRERERQNSTALSISQEQLEGQLERNANDFRVSLANLAESARHNASVEGETAYHNRQTEQEQFRSNKANEILSAEKTRVQEDQNIRSASAQNLASITGAGNIGVANTRNDIQSAQNAASNQLTRRSQNLTTVTNLMKFGQDFYSTNVNLLRGRKRSYD